MFDLNTIITNALNQAVEQATKPLIERITALESQALAARLSELEDANPAERLAQLEKRTEHQAANVNVWTSSDITNIYTRLTAIEERSPTIATSEDMMRHFESMLETTNQRIDVLEGWHEDAITAEQVGSLIEDALSEIDWEEQVQDALNSNMLEETVNDAIDEMLSELRIARR